MTSLEQLQKEVHESNDRLHETVRDGFSGIHSRLDILNGRVFTGERDRAAQGAELAALHERVTNLELAAPSRWRERGAVAGAGAALGLLVDFVAKLLGK
jgi:hypothetical protein